MTVLAGLNVLDLSQGIAGPYCGAILAREGADVVKVEPAAGDWARSMGLRREGATAVVIAYNTGKRSICVDATTPEGREVLRRLADRADVLIQNFRPGVADRLGVGYDALAASNPALLYLSISGFGATGPFASMPATDNVMQALTGMMHANRDAAGVPRQINLYLADIAAALYAAQRVSAALYRREKDGVGHHIEVSLLEACAALQSGAILSAAFAGSTAPGQATAPAGVFATRDGHVSISTLNDAMFARTARTVGREDWLRDSRFASARSRIEHREAINAELAAALSACATQEWNERFAAADVLYAPVQSYAAFQAHPATLHQGIFDAVAPDLPLARHPGITGTPGAAPAIGEHSREILSQFGFAPAEIASLIQSQTVLQQEPLP